MSDPPWRLDPLQTIIRVHAKSKKKKKGGGGPKDEPQPEAPIYCQGILNGCPLGLCATCFCPGILCIGPQGCCGINAPPCHFIGLTITCGTPTAIGACFSGCWVDNMWQVCPGNCAPGQIELAPDMSALPAANFYSASTLATSPPHYP
jgi:hypothetical protein